MPSEGRRSRLRVMKQEEAAGERSRKIWIASSSPTDSFLFGFPETVRRSSRSLGKRRAVVEDQDVPSRD